ncbi:MAG: hypothetical protein ACRDRX_15310 [Pseudonocardiaceae bacterium]
MLATQAGIGADAIGKMIDKYKMAKHLSYQITDTALTYQPNRPTSLLQPPWTASTASCSPTGW